MKHSSLALVVLLCGAAAAQDTVRLGRLTAMPVKWDLEANYKTFAETLERHAGEKPDIVVTPELFPGRLRGGRRRLDAGEIRRDGSGRKDQPLCGAGSGSGGETQNIHLCLD